MGDERVSDAFASIFGQDEYVAQPVFVLRKFFHVEAFERGGTEQPSVFRNCGKGERQTVPVQTFSVIDTNFFKRRPRGEVVPFLVERTGKRLDVAGLQ